MDRFKNIDSLIAKYNSLLYYKHREEGLLKHENGFVYINGYEKNTIQIIQQIGSLTSSGLGGYVESYEQWVQNTGYKIDSEEVTYQSENENDVSEMEIQNILALNHQLQKG